MSVTGSVTFDANNATASQLSNVSKDSSEEETSDAVKYSLMTTFLLVGVLTVVLNIFVLFIVYRYSWMRTNTNLIIASMAVTDLSFGISAFLAGLFKWGEFFSVGGVFCYLYNICDVTSAHASLFHVLAVNAERYLAITRPLTYGRVFKRRRLYVYITVIWVTSLAFACLYVFNMTYVERCLPDVPRNVIWTLLTLTVTYPLPLLLTVAIYVHIVVITLRHFNFLKKHTATSTSSSQPQNKHMKMIRSVAVIFAAYLLCWVPTFSILIGVNICIILDIELDFSNFVMMFYFVEVLSYANSLINPVIYFISSRSFQRAAKKIFRIHDSTDTPTPARTVDTSACVNAKDEITRF